MTFDGYPLFRCNRAMFAYWAARGVLRRNLCNTIAKTWKTGAVILTPALYAVGTVDPLGRAEDLPGPYKQFEMWQICNAPSARYKECACRRFYDPESGGPWGARDDKRAREQHHPHCQFERRALPAWKQDYRSAWDRKRRGLAPQARPDEWHRTRESIA
jgi:hypothetical protein